MSTNKNRRNRGRNNKEHENKSQSKERFMNHPEWYSQDGQMLSDVASLPFNKLLGVPFDTPVQGSATLKYAVPGLMQFGVKPVLPSGRINTVTSAANIAARTLYAWVRHANSGRTNYESQDLFMYILAMGEVYAIYAHLAKIYGFANSYSNTNRYMPRAVIEAAGFDHDILISNLADFRYRLNQIAVKIGSLAVPSGFAYIERKQWIYSGIYKDHDSSRSQLYSFRPLRTWIFNPVKYTTGGALEDVKFPDTSQTSNIHYNAFIKSLDDMVNSLLNNEDINIMSGDIIKAYGQDNLVKLASIPTDFFIEPVYDESVLSQIENMTVFTPASVRNGSYIVDNENINAWDVVQTPTQGIFQAKFINNSADYTTVRANKLINFHNDAPTPEQVMSGTRLTNIVTRIGGGNELETSGTEMVIESNIYLYGAGDTNADPFVMHKVESTFLSTFFRLHYEEDLDMVKWLSVNEKPLSSFPIARALHSNFRRAPIIQTTLTGPGWDNFPSGNLILPIYTGQLDTYTTISDEQLNRLHDVASLSLFAAPQVGRYNSTKPTNK